MDTNYKYDKIQVCGHPRSGTHYIAALVCKNFFNTKDGSYLECYGTHKTGDTIKIRPNILYVYVERRFQDVVKSFYVIRHRFGIPDEISFEEFFKSKYSNMWTRNVGKFKIKINTGDKDTYNTNVCNLFRDITMAPRAYWEHHINTWIKARSKHNNIVIISYNKTLLNMNYSMRKVANCLGSDKTEFIDVKDKVGWIPQ